MNKTKQTICFKTNELFIFASNNKMKRKVNKNKKEI